MRSNRVVVFPPIANDLRYIIPGKSRLHISNGEGLVPRDVIAVYRLRDRAHEKAMVKYLRAND